MGAITDRIRTGFTISAAAHIAVVLWAVITFVSKPLNAQQESMAVDVVTADQFSKMTAGQQDAPKVETPKPVVEKVAEAKPVEPTKAKVSEKKEIVAVKEVEPPPPEEKKVEKKEKKPAEAKADPIAEALKKDEAKKPEEEKKAEAKPPTPVPPKKPIPVPPKFDPMKIAALLNKQEARREATTGSTLNDKVSLGVSSGQAAQLSMNELDALRARLAQLWSPPAAANPQELIVLVRVQLKRDGTLQAPPMVLNSGNSPAFVAARESAMRAIFRGQPYSMLRQETYDQWSDIEIKFDPREMFGG